MKPVGRRLHVAKLCVRLLQPPLGGLNLLLKNLDRVNLNSIV